MTFDINSYVHRFKVRFSKKMPLSPVAIIMLKAVKQKLINWVINQVISVFYIRDI